jgi:predicted transcriptional regulator of viral defense system
MSSRRRAAVIHFLRMPVMTAGWHRRRGVQRMDDNIPHMSDVDHDGLYRLAESQAGYFTAAQAIEAGMDRSTLRHHARPGGRYERARRGLYRLRHFPSTPNEHVVAAWLPLRNAGAVVSHESALELYELSDVIPGSVHLTIARSERGQRPRPGVRLHTVEQPLRPSEIRNIGTVPVTTPERTIIDALQEGTQLEQVELAARQAVERGLTTSRRLRAAAASRPARVRSFIDRVLEEIPA